MPTKPTLAIYQDVAAYPGTYINLSFAHSFDVGHGVTLDFGAAAGYYAENGSYSRTYERSTAAYTGPNYNALHDGMVKAGLTIPVSKGLIVQPVIEYWFPLSSEAQKTMGYNRQGEKISYNPDGYVGHNTVIGINIVYGF